jgi:transglutaminase-like putative cysteine protease
MLIRIGFEIVFNVPAPVPILFVLSTHPERDYSIRRPGRLQVEPYVPVEEFRDSFGNRCGRLVAPGAVQHPVQDLPSDVLPYLLPSRYCEVDRLSDIAWNLFGHTPEGWSRAQAICDWVHGHVTFGYKYARPTKSAYDVYEERRGVCRDFTHLALTFCRCMNIPARYATGYLGEIGVPLSPDPMDFSGWFEVYLGDRWYTMDARHNHPRIGRIVMARGRDAVDVALTTSFGTSTLAKFVVWTDEVGPEALAEPQAIKPI